MTSSSTRAQIAKKKSKMLADAQNSYYQYLLDLQKKLQSIQSRLNSVQHSQTQAGR